MSVSRKLQGNVNKACFKEILISSVCSICFDKCFMGDSLMFQGRFKDASNKLQVYFKSAINMLKKKFQKCFKQVLRVFNPITSWVYDQGLLLGGGGL